MLFIKIAWRNIWRNYRRSLIIISAISVGIFGLLASAAFMVGLGDQMIDNAIGTHIAHIEIHKKGFNDNRIVALNISEPEKIIEAISEDQRIIAFTPRVISSGLISSSEASSGVMIVGIEPKKESEVSTIKRSIIQGQYLEDSALREVVIGEGLAKKLKVRLNEKIVIMAQALGNELGSDAYRVKGIYRTVSSDFDKYMVYVGIQAGQRLLNFGNRISEVAIIVNRDSSVISVQESLKQRLNTDSYEILSWMDIIPMVVKEVKIFEQMIYIFFLIVFVAMAFGIANTLIMAVFERIKELGIMMAIGTKPKEIFKMVVIESISLSFGGIVVGTLLTYVLVSYLSVKGMNLSVIARSLETMGVGSVIYPNLTFFDTALTSLIALATAIVASIYPAVKAAKLVPVEAIRYV